MRQMKNSIPSSNLMFEEEVSENEVYDKKNQSDIIYVSSNKNKVKFLIVLAIILIIISIFSALLGFIYLDKDRSNIVDDGKAVINHYDLFISHSNQYYGGNLISFAEHRSEESAYSYSFNVSNQNDLDIKYKIVLVNALYTSDDIDMKDINYSLFNDDVLISSGNLQEVEEFSLADMLIKSNSIDDINFKIWSSTIDKNLKFTFKINILV